jgi:hypothetical protein
MASIGIEEAICAGSNTCKFPGSGCVRFQVKRFPKTIVRRLIAVFAPNEYFGAIAGSRSTYADVFVAEISWMGAGFHFFRPPV